MSKKNRARRQGLPVPLFPEGPRGFDLHWLHKENDGRHDRIGYVARRLPPDWPKRLQATQGYARQFNYGKGPRPLDERVSGTLWYPLHWSWRSDPKAGIIGYLNDVMQHHKLPGDEVGIGDSPEVSFRLDAIGRRPFPRAFPAPQILTTIYPDGEFARYLSTQFMGLVTLNAPGVRDGLPGPVALAVRGIPLSNGRIPEGLGDPTKLILLFDPLCVVVGIGEVDEIDPDGVLFPRPSTAAGGSTTPPTTPGSAPCGTTRRATSACGPRARRASWANWARSRCSRRSGGAPRPLPRSPSRCAPSSPPTPSTPRPWRPRST